MNQNHSEQPNKDRSGGRQAAAGPGIACRAGVEPLVERILSEGPIGMSAAARLLGTFRNGRPTVPSTITRWVQRGHTLPDGRRLRLEAIHVGGRLLTSAAAVVRFISAQQSDPAAGSLPADIRGPAARSRASQAAADFLDGKGL